MHCSVVNIVNFSAISGQSSSWLKSLTLRPVSSSRSSMAALSKSFLLWSQADRWFNSFLTCSTSSSIISRRFSCPTNLFSVFFFKMWIVLLIRASSSFESESTPDRVETRLASFSRSIFVDCYNIKLEWLRKQASSEKKTISIINYIAYLPGRLQ